MSPSNDDKKYYELLKQLIRSVHKRAQRWYSPLNEVDLLIHFFYGVSAVKGYGGDEGASLNNIDTFLHSNSMLKAIE